tara:strand:- start:142048 stop:142623 length:576 start_codon:yes stop_codon:yes gene_type:complete
MSLFASKSQKSALESGILIFIIADMSMFGVFFMVYCFERSGNPAMYQASQSELNQTLGMINTMILLVSSWFVVIATRAFRDMAQRTAAFFLALAFLCGCVFVVNKFVEYSEKLSQDITILTNDFFMFYYVLTGIHMLHVVGGMIILLVFLLNLAPRKISRLSPAAFEGGAAYWHMVDLLWVLIFPLIYFLI